jgi:DNA polymerase
MHGITIIGEAYGAEEERKRSPFVGASGWELTRMLDEAGIARGDCFLTNVFNLRPAGNKIEELCGEKKEGIKGYPALVRGKYVRKEFLPELERLGDEILERDPNIIICLGNTPLWALTGNTGISKLRGTTTTSTHCVSGYKCLPTYHPAAVIRKWELRSIVVIDFAKALRESAFPEIHRPHRQIFIPETLEDINDFFIRHLPECTALAVDIETSGGRITCIGFAPTRETAMVIPIVNKRRKGGNHWSDGPTEHCIWQAIRRVLSSPMPAKIFQNGLYDISFLWRAYGIGVRGAEEDTMLLHHALYPESLKGLGFLGSIYCDEGAWKGMRKGTETIKRED